MWSKYGEMFFRKAGIRGCLLSRDMPDGLDEMSGYAKWAFKNMLPAEKKYPKECEEARHDSFQRILSFLDGWT